MAAPERERPDLHLVWSGADAALGHSRASTSAMGLTALRPAAQLTQAELARRIGVAQAAVSRVGQLHDVLLSALHAYL
jgi:hypothetical protein